MKEEALKLADELEQYCLQNEGYKNNDYVDMIRRLVEELDEKNYRILELTKRYKALTWNDKQTKPEDIWTSCLDCGQRVTGDSIHTCSPQTKQGEPDLIAYEHAGKIVHYMYTSADKEVKLYRHPPQTKPLSEDAIESIAFDYANEDGELDLTGFARAIEERHGIK